MKKLFLVFLMLAFFPTASSAEAQESISKRKTYELTAETDDAEENAADGTMYLTGHLELAYHSWAGGGRNQIIGLRFSKFDLPDDIVIESAYLQFFSIDLENKACNLSISGEASVNSNTFANTAYNISSRTKTTANITWEVPAWGSWGEHGLAQRSPDISPVIREIVSQNGFTSESPITIFMQGSGTRIAYSFDDKAYAAPKLIVNYHYLGAVPNPVSYKDRYNIFFSLGTSMSVDCLSDLAALGSNNIFTRLTAEGSMKWGSIHPEYNTFSFERSDGIANNARANNMKMTGHTLLWHRSNPAWLFQNGEDGSVSPSVLSLRLKNHIYKMVERYGDVVDNWDVVNEVISSSSDSSKIYRDAEEGSQWWGVFNSPEFIKLAFQYTAEANAVYGKSSELFLNEYGAESPVKLDKLLKAVDYLKGEGVQIDGIGLQGHWFINEHPISQIKDAFDKIIAKGLKIKISEMDISIYNGDYTAPLSEAAEQEQAYYYQELFELFRSYKNHIRHVSFWGIYDGPGSWLSYNHTSWNLLPADQWDFPLLFDVALQPKKAFYAIMDFNEGAGNNQPPVAVPQTDVTSGTAPLVVAFNGSESYDSDGSIIEYSWTFGDGGGTSGASATHSYNAPGSYTAVLTVKDNLGSVGTASVAVTVEPNPSNVIRVQNITMSQVKVTKKNAARTVLTVQNMLGDPISGVTVSGTWSGLVNGDVSGATDSSGTVAFTSNATSKTGAVIIFTVNSLSKTDYQYNSSSNLMTSASIAIK